MTRLQKSLMTGASSLVLALVLAPTPVQAACPGTVTAAESPVGQQVLANGESCTVEAGGAINTAGVIAINAPNDDNRISNSGSIATTGGYAHGIYAKDNNTITNSGSIATTGYQAYGIYAKDNNTITNSGSISTTKNFAYGINTKNNNSVTNSGSISTTGDFAYGINTINNNTISNSGSISTTGEYANGIYAYSNNSITNSGSISTTGKDAHGIFAYLDNNRVTNSGLIRATGASADAIRLKGNENTLALNPGSVLIGPINFLQATNTLTVGNGLSIANTFTGNLPGTINSNGAPFAVNGLQVAVVDPTNLAAQDEILADLTGGISSTVLNRLSGLRNGVLGVTSNPRPMYVAGAKDGGGASGSRQYWLQGFGAVREQDGDGPVVDTTHRLAGFVSGMDAHYSYLTRAGFFLGGSFGEVSAQFNSQDTEADSLFGGVYLSTLRGRTAIDVALTVGYSDYDRERMTANNLVPTGIQTARAGYDGWFVSPEITFTRPFWPMGRRIEQSVTLRYAGLFLDGFTETGAAAPLTVQGRDVHVGQARAQLAVPLAHSANNGAQTRLMLKGGAEVRTQLGDRDVSGALLARNITFDPGGDDVVAGAFAGIEFAHTSAGGSTFFASAEGQIDSGGGRQVSGKAGIKFRF